MVNLLKPKMVFCDIDIMPKVVEALDDIGHNAHFVTFNDFSEKALYIEQLYKVFCDEDSYR